MLKLYTKEIEHFRKWDIVYEKSKAKEALTPEEEELKKNIKNDDEEGFVLSINSPDIHNLIRLGLIIQLPPKIQIEESGIIYGKNQFGPEIRTIEAKYEPYSSFHRMTDLGFQFIEMVEEKK